MNEIPVLNEISFYFFALISLAPIVYLMKRPGSFTTFPVLSSAVWCFYILPQAYGILVNPMYIPYPMYKDGYPVTMFMCSLCVISGYIGWNIYSKGNIRKPTVGLMFDHNKEFIIGVVIGSIGIIAFVMLANMTGGILRNYSVGGSYSLDWRGEEVLLAFVEKICLLSGIVLVAFSYFKRKTKLKIITLVLLTSVPLANIIFLARRSEVVFLVMSIATPLFFTKRWIPKRSIILFAIIAMMAVVFIFPIIRGYMQIGADKSNLLDIDYASIIDKGVLGGQKHKEFNNSVGLIASYWETGDYAFGAQMWNSWVKTSVPRTIVGKNIKEGIMMRDHDMNNVTKKAYGWVKHPYMSNSAASLLFVNFSFIGCIMFTVLGYISRKFYELAISGQEKYQLSYTFLMILIPHWIATGFGKMPRQIFFYFIIYAIAFYFLKKRKVYTMRSRYKSRAIETR